MFYAFREMLSFTWLDGTLGSPMACGWLDEATSFNCVDEVLVDGIFINSKSVDEEGSFGALTCSTISFSVSLILSSWLVTTLNIIKS